MPGWTVPTAAVVLSASDCGTDGARSHGSQVPFDTRADDAKAHTPICLNGAFTLGGADLDEDGGVFHVNVKERVEVWRHGRARLGVVDLMAPALQLGSRIMDVLF